MMMFFVVVLLLGVLHHSREFLRERIRRRGKPDGGETSDEKFNNKLSRFVTHCQTFTVLSDGSVNCGNILFDVHNVLVLSKCSLFRLAYFNWQRSLGK